jgi:hypothetical protein
MSYIKNIREMVSRMAIDALPEQVFVNVDPPSQSVSITWRNSTLESAEQLAVIVAKAQALLPENVKTYQVSITGRS